MKAIETFYKGYLFRSRLEARWAVFFDKLGVEWYYEGEGYDLPRCGYYLPDFYLPQTDSFVEIKPLIKQVDKLTKHDDKILNVYFAGKFVGGSGEFMGIDWRESEFGIPMSGYYFIDPYEINATPHISAERKFSYCGPYPVDTTGGHGSVPGHVIGDMYTNSLRKGVLRNCLSNIDGCDAVFAWIHTTDCYGTIAEIGYAKHAGKSIKVGVLEGLDISDLWFVLCMADNVTTAISAGEAYDSLFSINREVDKAAELCAESSSKVIVIYGDPVDHTSILFSPDGSSDRSRTIQSVLNSRVHHKISAAAEAARSSRFEHGQSGAKAKRRKSYS